jgi:hypothetical protein
MFCKEGVGVWARRLLAKVIEQMSTSFQQNKTSAYRAMCIQPYCSEVAISVKTAIMNRPYAQTNELQNM